MIPFVGPDTRLSEETHTSSPIQAMNTATIEKPSLRADARRNREAILAAAKELFAEQGLDAQMPDIARAAKVGVGTVYRHFPTKDDLIEALVAERFERVAEHGAEALERAKSDPWQAFAEYMRLSVELQANDRGLSQVMSSRPELMEEHAHRSGTFELSEKLVALAQKSGDLRRDAEVLDVPMIICGLGHVTQAAIAGKAAPGMSWERFLAIVLDGLRAPGSSKLPPRAA
jgi:AcrR family transcriptional regulator